MERLARRLRGQYLAFDGPDGCGKTTLVGQLARELRNIGVTVEVTREPGGTFYGEKIRDVLLRPEDGLASHEVMCDEAEALLFMAARAQLVREKVKPLMAAGVTVLTDRSAASTFAYQCEASGLPWDKMSTVYDLAVPAEMRPSLTVILDLPVEVARERNVSKFQAQPGSTDDRAVRDRIEQRHGDYYAKVRTGYLAFATAFYNCRTVDASGTPAETYTRVLDTLVAWHKNLLI